MKIYGTQDVFSAALERIEYIFDEFPEVVVGFSGGKDSTVTLNLALMVAEKKGRLPLKVIFLDQEAEWMTVIDYIRDIMADPRIEPMWYQIPIKISSGASHDQKWLYCWQEDQEQNWIRPKEPNSIKENVYGTDRFKLMFAHIFKHDYPGKKACYLAGVRAEESPTRFMALTGSPKYEHITYAKRLNKKEDHYTFYPLYDWSYRDIWKAIHDHGWKYCKVYDYMYQYGVKVVDMRVSHVHHVTAIRTLYYLQEIEPKNWNRLVKRVSGINTVARLGKNNFMLNRKSELPFMFKDWKEYRDHLLDNLIPDKETYQKFKRRFDKMDKKYEGIGETKPMYIVQINSLLTDDYHFTKLDNWERSPEVNTWRKWSKGKDYYNHHMATNKYINASKKLKK